MWLHKALKAKLISQKTAIEIARLVTLDRFGEPEVERNLPFVAVEQGDVWVVTGTNNKEFNEKNPPFPAWRGPLLMKISQYDGQILSFTFLGDLPWAKVPQPPSPAQENPPAGDTNPGDH